MTAAIPWLLIVQSTYTVTRYPGFVLITSSSRVMLTIGKDSNPVKNMLTKITKGSNL